VSEVRIAAEPRTEFGKGAARRVRRAHKVPAVLYGHGDAPRHFSLPGHELMLALKSDPNVLLTLETEQGDQLALAKAVVRDPIKGFYEHVDLVAVRKGERVTVEVPVTVVGEVAGDVIVDQQSTTLSVEADATDLPSGLEVDVAGMGAGESVHAGQVPLPAGATLVGDPEQAVVQLLAAPTAEEVEADLVAAEVELGAGAAGTTAEDVVGSDEPAGSESDKAGEGDAVGETAAPASETPAQ
jgi:large subunit ribosomal protein L25